MARTAQAASIRSVDDLPEVLTLKTTTPIPQSTSYNDQVLVISYFFSVLSACLACFVKELWLFAI